MSVDGARRRRADCALNSGHPPPAAVAATSSPPIRGVPPARTARRPARRRRSRVLVRFRSLGVHAEPGFDRLTYVAASCSSSVRLARRSRLPRRLRHAVPGGRQRGAEAGGQRHGPRLRVHRVRVLLFKASLSRGFVAVAIPVGLVLLLFGRQRDPAMARNRRRAAGQLLLPHRRRRHVRRAHRSRRDVRPRAARPASPWSPSSTRRCPTSRSAPGWSGSTWCCTPSTSTP